MPEAIEITNMRNHKSEREYVLNTVKENGKLLEFADDVLRDDKEIVLEAVKNNPEALEFASDRLKKIEKLYMILLVEWDGRIVMQKRTY